MKATRTLIITALLLGTNAYGQNWLEFPSDTTKQVDTISTSTPGQVEFTEPEKLQEFEEGLAKQDVNVPSYQLLLFFDKSRDKAIQVKKAFEKKYKGIKVIIKYESSNFKVLAGPFFNEVKAEYYRRTVQADYPNALVVKSEAPIKTK